MTQEKSPKILTIDDEKSIRESIKNYLFDYGYTVLDAENGRDGLTKFFEEEPDLVLVDLRMPEIDGLDVLAKVRGKSPDTPVIVVSGTGVISDVVEALRLGAWDFLLKPIQNMEVLHHAVQKSLERSQLITMKKEYQERLEKDVEQKTKKLRLALEKIKKISLEVIYRLARAADYKDETTGNHIKRMSLYAYTIAKKMSLKNNMAEQILFAAPLHDVGKIGIPDNILLKPGKLNQSEWEVMKTHTTIGAGILEDSDIEFLRFAQSIALYHHERWDGTGYPENLSGAAIPIEARVVAVADVFDALSSKRPYKGEYPLKVCEKIMEESTGTYFDPEITDAFFDSLDEILQIKQEWSDSRPSSV